MGKFTATDNEILFPARAVYYPMPDGTFRLARVQAFNSPRFREQGWESRDKKNECSKLGADDVEDLQEGREAATGDIERATRRARKNAFDLIMCNHDLDTFATFTYSPERVTDKADYGECYKYLNTWLSNRVQRKGLKYVCVPERTKVGDIHFHAIMNSSALNLVRATSAKDGRALSHEGNPVYNISDWGRGFTTAEIIRQREAGENEREAVSKYIFKYMGKQAGQKIGGRYVLLGGDLVRPIYVYGDSAAELLDGTITRWENHKELSNGVVYDELSFI